MEQDCNLLYYYPPSYRFPQFALLPPELRTRIWILHAQNRQPDVEHAAVAMKILKYFGRHVWVDLMDTSLGDRRISLDIKISTLDERNHAKYMDTVHRCPIVCKEMYCQMIRWPVTRPFDWCIGCCEDVSAYVAAAEGLLLCRVLGLGTQQSDYIPATFELFVKALRKLAGI